MPHLVFIEDSNGDVIDHATFCSDFCAQVHPDYAGWNGAYEIVFNKPCYCGQTIAGVGGEEK